MPSRSARIGVDFQPSRDGLTFANSWPKGARIRLRRKAVGTIYGGLCGGMCHFARESWLAGRPIPADATPHNPEFVDVLVTEQIESLDLPTGPLRYLAAQLPPAHVTRRRCTATTLAAVRAELNAGRPSYIGLVRALSFDPLALGKHHVVLVHHLREDPHGATLGIYDPNHPGDDRVQLRVEADSSIEHNRSALPVYALLAF